MEEPFSDDVDIMMDLNRHIDNLIIVGGVDFNKTGSKRSARYNRATCIMYKLGLKGMLMCVCARTRARARTLPCVCLCVTHDSMMENSKINRGPQLMLEAVCMDWLISNTQCIGSE